jgi:hypothetical protein
MKPDRNISVFLLAGAIALAALVGVVAHLARSPASDAVALGAHKLALLSQIRGDLGRSVEAEKRAVLAITDEESREFADESRRATKALEQERSELGSLIAGDERRMWDDFTRSLSDLERLDIQILELAVKNTNVKAAALASGPSTETLLEMDEALARVLSRSAAGSEPSSKQVMLLASRARTAAYRIQVLLPAHIAQQNDKKMDELEARMARDDGEVRRDLKELSTLLPKDDHDLGAALSSYERLATTRKQILALSRENTDVRSLEISLNQKRKITAACDDALAALERTIAGEPALAPRHPLE